jgi:hypothetical protein
MRKVEHLSEFPRGSYVAQFYGKEYKDAVELANKSSLLLVSYYEQIHCGKQKSILVCYHAQSDS